MSLDRVLVVGAGLIGSSVGLALRANGVDVTITDSDQARLQLAADLGVGSPATSLGSASAPRADVALLCVPPAAMAGELLRLQSLNVARTYSDVTSIKAQPQAKAQSLGVDMTTFVGGHPLAGGERAGPGAARADLFLGRSWLLTPTAAASQQALAHVHELVSRCGAEPRVMSAADHDAAMALVSHLPQALASALAAQLVAARGNEADLAGQGFRDMTRIADSDAAMWGQIAAGNAQPLAAALRRVANELGRLADALEGDEARGQEGFTALVEAGNAGRARLPGKHGAGRRRYQTVPVVVADEPGALARLLFDAGEAGVNVEDLSLEHSPGAPVGLCELLVEPAQADRLATVLAQRGWAVHHGKTQA